jgi:hypothetical protein
MCVIIEYPIYSLERISNPFFGKIPLVIVDKFGFDEHVILHWKRWVATTNKRNNGILNHIRSWSVLQKGDRLMRGPQFLSRCSLLGIVVFVRCFCLQRCSLIFIKSQGGRRRYAGKDSKDAAAYNDDTDGRRLRQFDLIGENKRQVTWVASCRQTGKTWTTYRNH